MCCKTKQPSDVNSEINSSMDLDFFSEKILKHRIFKFYKWVMILFSNYILPLFKFQYTVKIQYIS